MAQLAEKRQVKFSEDKVKKIYKNSLPRAHYIKDNLIYIFILLILSCVGGYTVIRSNVVSSKAQIKFQKMTQKIENMQKKNTNAKQEISELSSQKRLSEIARQVGLTMDENNTRNVTK